MDTALQLFHVTNENKLATMNFLKEHGWHVAFTHMRICTYPYSSTTTGEFPGKHHMIGSTILPKGGRTICSIKKFHLNGSVTEITGESRCYHKDTYVRKLGANIALSRALDALQEIDIQLAGKV